MSSVTHFDARQLLALGTLPLPSPRTNFIKGFIIMMMMMGIVEAPKLLVARSGGGSLRSAAAVRTL
jgi:hypothetical protein